MTISCGLCGIFPEIAGPDPNSAGERSGTLPTVLGESLQSLQDQLNSKNFYQMNPSFDIGLTREPCDCQGECVQ